ncbi:hypothetical protein Droror1_Dr00021022 [Drosera rotundifolia]
MIALLGHCAHGETRFLVYELMEQGSLENHLHGSGIFFSRVRVKGKNSALTNASALSDTSCSTQCRVDAVRRSDSHAAVAPICQSNRIRRSVWDQLERSMITNLGVDGSEGRLSGEELVGQHLSLPIAPSGLYNRIGETGELSKGGRTIA